MTEDTPFQREYADHLLHEVLNGHMTRRQLLVRAGVFGLSATAVGQLLAACGGTSTSGGGGKPGGTLRVTMVSPTVALEPVTMYDTGSIAVCQQVAEYLAWVNNDLSLRPVLAESWSPSSDVKTWTFKLRKGVTFQDGKPFGADDVVATMNLILDPKTVASALAALKGILSPGGVVKVDDSTVAFHLDQASADFPYLVASTNYGAVILPSTYTMGTWQTKPVGTGPFMMTAYTPKQTATFKKNPKYWQSGRPYLDSVQVTFNDQTQAQGLALQAGSVDMMLYTPFQGSQALFQDANLKVLAAASTMHRELHMRVDMAPWTDKRVRQALAYTLDRPALIQALFNGKGTLANDNVFFPLYPLAPKDLPQRAQDIAKAKQLLSDAGMPNGYTATMNVEDYEEIPQYATLVQQMAKQAGIILKLNQVTVTYYYGGGKNQPWLVDPMGIVDWTFRGTPDEYVNAYITNGVWNSSKWSDPAFDAAVKGYQTTVDETKRREYAKQAALAMMDGTPAVIPYTVSVNRAMRQNVMGVVADPAEFLDLTTASLK